MAYNFRDTKRMARRALHDVLKIPANYYAHGDANDAPVLISVRLTTHFATADPAQGRYGLAASETVNPSIIFMRDEMEPVTGAVLSFEADEAYQVEAVELSDDITRTATVLRLSPADAAMFVPPIPNSDSTVT